LTAESRAEEAVDQLEKHLGGFMPEDEEYLIQVEPETSLNDYELGDSFKVDYRLETTIPYDSGPDSEFEFKGSHLIHGELSEVREEYEALIDEFEDRFQVSDLEYPEWEVIQ
jgi:gamma-glutamylcyclotransferase (GGCT)/AIG2-like uncharacterized protein YtfP